MNHTIRLKPNNFSRRILGCETYDEIPRIEAGDVVRMICDECDIDVVLHCAHNSTSLCYDCWGYSNFASGLCTQLGCENTQIQFKAVEEILEEL